MLLYRQQYQNTYRRYAKPRPLWFSVTRYRKCWVAHAIGRGVWGYRFSPIAAAPAGAGRHLDPPRSMPYGAQELAGVTRYGKWWR